MIKKLSKSPIKSKKLNKSQQLQNTKISDQNDPLKLQQENVELKNQIQKILKQQEEEKQKQQLQFKEILSLVENKRTFIQMQNFWQSRIKELEASIKEEEFKYQELKNEVQRQNQRNFSPLTTQQQQPYNTKPNFLQKEQLVAQLQQENKELIKMNQNFKKKIEEQEKLAGENKKMQSAFMKTLKYNKNIETLDAEIQTTDNNQDKKYPLLEATILILQKMAEQISKIAKRYKFDIYSQKEIAQLEPSQITVNMDGPEIYQLKKLFDKFFFNLSRFTIEQSSRTSLIDQQPEKKKAQEQEQKEQKASLQQREQDAEQIKKLQEKINELNYIIEEKNQQIETLSSLDSQNKLLETIEYYENQMKNKDIQMDEVRDELGDLLKPFWECIIEVKNENLLSLFESSWKIYLKEEANTQYGHKPQYYIISRNANFLEFFMESIFEKEELKFQTNQVFVKNLNLENDESVQLIVKQIPEIHKYFQIGSNVNNQLIYQHFWNQFAIKQCNVIIYLTDSIDLDDINQFIKSQKQVIIFYYDKLNDQIKDLAKNQGFTKKDRIKVDQLAEKNIILSSLNKQVQNQNFLSLLQQEYKDLSEEPFFDQLKKYLIDQLPYFIDQAIQQLDFKMSMTQKTDFFQFSAVSNIKKFKLSRRHLIYPVIESVITKQKVCDCLIIAPQQQNNQKEYKIEIQEKGDHALIIMDDYYFLIRVKFTKYTKSTSNQQIMITFT